MSTGAVRKRLAAVPGLPEAEPCIVDLHRASTIRPEPIRWLWPGWLARGKLHILAGAPGVAKTTIAMHIAACVTTGAALPGGYRPDPGNVLIWSGEDDPADTLVPRLLAAGTDLERAFFVGDARDGAEVRSFDPATDIPALAVEADAIGGAALIVVDPIVSAVAGDSHKNTEVRRALQPLVTMAERLGAAVLGISHFSKGTAGRDPTERVTGSVAFGALARLVLVAAKRQDADGSSDRMLARAKSNIGPDGGGFGYAVEQLDLGHGIHACRIAWGSTLEGSARDLLGQAEADDAEAEERRDVDSFLEDLLFCGEQTAKAIYRDAEAAGYSRDQIKRAKRRLGVQTTKTAMEGGWMWRLPPELPAGG